MRAIQYLMAFYNAKVQAAALVMRYGYDHDMSPSSPRARCSRKALMNSQNSREADG